MPAYQCRDCDEFFRSKDALQEHRDSCTGGTTGDTVYEDIKQYVSQIDFSLSPRRFRNLLTLRNAGLMFGVLMMATLFLGTASFMSSTAPSRGSGTPTGAATATSNPALGYNIRSPGDVPQLGGSGQPQQVSNQPLSTEKQLWAVTRGGQGGKPGAVIYYNCETACPGLARNLTAFAQNYGGWVYVAPNPEIGSRVAVTGFRFIQRHESFDAQQLNTDICGYYRQLQVLGPAACAT